MFTHAENSAISAQTPGFQLAPTSPGLAYTKIHIIEGAKLQPKRFRWFIQLLHKVESECWLYTGPKTHNGYGTFGIGGRTDTGGKNLRAHRVAYELWVGKIPEGKLVLHDCNVRNCCNPVHLKIGTAFDNTKQMMQEGRNKYKTHRKITLVILQEMVELRKEGYTLTEIAQMFDVSHECVRENLQNVHS